MQISVFGLGYVGVVTSACLSRAGHDIIGVDPNETKVSLINQGKSPIVEDDVEAMIVESTQSGKLRATGDAREALLNTELTLICVGTPSKANGDLDLTYVERVCAEIGAILKDKSEPHVVVVRSTMLPGTVRNVVLPTIMKAAGEDAANRIVVCNNPEFLREGSAVYDFYNPPKTVIGETDAGGGDVVAALYDGIDAPLILTSIRG